MGWPELALEWRASCGVATNSSLPVSFLSLGPLLFLGSVLLFPLVKVILFKVYREQNGSWGGYLNTEISLSFSLSPSSPKAASVSLSVCFYFHQSLSVSAPLPCASPICAQKPPSLSAPAPAHRSYFGDFGCSRKPDSSKELFLRPPARTTRSTRPAPPWDSRTGKSQRGAARN